MKSRFLVILSMFVSLSARADIHEKIDKCQVSTSKSCVLEILRDLAGPRVAPSLVCGKDLGDTVEIRVKAAANATVNCYYTGTSNNGQKYDLVSFNDNLKFDSDSGMWMCGKWSKGNSQFVLTIAVNDKKIQTTEPEILSQTCK
jgi:hypothetical protein